MPKPFEHRIDRAALLSRAMSSVILLCAVLVGCTSESRLPKNPIPYITRVIHLPNLDGDEPAKPEPPQTATAPEPEPEPAIRLVPADDPMLAEARIRGVSWPMVYNDGPTRQHEPQTGFCSYYNESQHTATGEHFNPEALTAAHKSLPFGTIVRCTREDTGDSVIVVINDRGPFVRGRILDLSRRAAEHLGMIRAGVTRCKIEVLAYPIIEAMGPKGNG
ncbi:septal ring lytic transglycosylase RlpA family protein [bacterium]|nr:septal ring lytic transglycosylase RlpA family protein [bacterium]